MQIKIRTAKKEDVFDLWSWRNHPEVRKRSFNRNEIDYETHKKWFYDKEKDKNSIIYIAEDENGRKIGQARFDMFGEKKAYANVNLNPEFFSKGLGSIMIRTATVFFLKERQDIKEVLARIMSDNAVSKRAFEKAGYFFSSEESTGAIIMSYKAVRKDR